jgi:hypothetical protein
MTRQNMSSEGLNVLPEQFCQPLELKLNFKPVI